MILALYITDLFNAKSPTEEFALQTIAFNEVNEYNLENKIFYIGNGVLEMYNKYKYTRKILYEPGQLLPNPMILRLKKKTMNYFITIYNAFKYKIFK